jgi:methylphosphotriester-DNA--protein-cysteine methyltransferase
MSVPTEEAKRLAEICDQLGGFAQCATALRSIAAERDALKTKVDEAERLIEVSASENYTLQSKKDQLEAENARLREAFQKYFGQSEATNIRALGEKDDAKV